MGDRQVKSTLTIKGIGRDKNGTYVCGASDDKMNITENVPLYVLGIYWEVSVEFSSS